MGRPVSTARMLAPLFVAGFLAYGYNNIFMTLAPTFVVELGGTLAEAGLQNSLYLAAAVVLRFFFGPLADRWSTKPVMAVGLAAFVVGGALFALCVEFWQVAFVRCLQAIGLAAFWSSATTTVSNVAPPAAQGWWLGLYRFVTSVSLLVGPLVAFELVEAAGFEACFWALAVCVAIGLACVFLMCGAGRGGESDSSAFAEGAPCDSRTARAADGASGEGRHNIEAKAQPSRLPSQLRRAFQGISGSVVAVVVGGTFVAAMGYGLLFSFGATFATAVGVAENAGWYFTLVGFGGLVANPVAGLLSDRQGPRRLFGAHLLLTGFGIALFVLSGASLVAFVISGLAVGYGYAGAMVCAQAQAARQVARAHRATILAWQQNAIDLGIAVASALFGLVFAAAGPAAVAPFAVQACLILMVGAALLISRAR